MYAKFRADFYYLNLIFAWLDSKQSWEVSPLTILSYWHVPCFKYQHCDSPPGFIDSGGKLGD